jgi:hypothetical protein
MKHANTIKWRNFELKKYCFELAGFAIITLAKGYDS